jgi:hypothetical protein
MLQKNLVALGIAFLFVSFYGIFDSSLDFGSDNLLTESTGNSVFSKFLGMSHRSRSASGNVRITSSQCSDSDGGRNFNQKGRLTYTRGTTVRNYEDSCSSGSRISEYYCSSFQTIKRTTANCPNGGSCVDGACVSVARTCTDSDGGDNVYEKGQLSTSYLRNKPTDDCIFGNLLLEQFCDGAETGNRIHTCKNTCVDGACTQPLPDTCVDSDGGDNVYEKGSLDVSYLTNSPTDDCITNNILLEQFCDGSQTGNKIHTCKNTCVDGACTQDVVDTIVEVNACSQKDYKMAYILLVHEGKTDFQDSLDKMNDLKSKVSEAFNVATLGTATMNTAHPVTILTVPSGFTLTGSTSKTTNLLDRFYETNPKDFDFITFYGDGFWTSGSQSHFLVNQNIQNIGVTMNEDKLGDTIPKNLKGINQMQDIRPYDFDGVFAKAFVTGDLHETGHQWWSRGIGDGFSGDRTGILEINFGGHPYRGLQSPWSAPTPLGSEYWVVNDDGVTYSRASFDLLNYSPKYHPFILYTMGLLDKSEYDVKHQIFDVGGAYTGRPYNFENAIPYSEVSVSDIINVMGPRICV